MVKNVLIVEDDLTTAESFAQAISGSNRLALVGLVHSVAAAKRALSGQKVDVCLVDLGLPDGSGLDVIRHACEIARPVFCLVISVFGDEPSVVSAIEAGASGYLLKDALTMSVTAEIDTLLAGGSPLSPIVAKLVLKRFKASQPQRLPESELVRLSPREGEVLNLIARGCTYSEVSKALGISNVTVATHLNNVYLKLSVHSRSEAVYEANRLGLIKF
jgi:DNA-binding NarL/FixJ family response regulator